MSASSGDEGGEYEVESILTARVAKKGKKKFWEYHIKWLGYDDPAENTWEPTESFFDKDMIDKFWFRVDLGGRDIEDLSLFEPQEEFIPTGPPRRKPKAKKPVPSTSSAPRASKLDETAANSSKGSKPPLSISAPPRKRARQEPSLTPSPPPKKKKLVRSQGSNSAGTLAGKRAQSIEMQSEIPPSETSEEEMETKISNKKPNNPIRKTLSNDKSTNKTKTGRPKSRQLKQIPRSPIKKSSLGRRIFESLDNTEDEAEDVPPLTEGAVSIPTATSPIPETLTSPEASQNLRVLSHRERASKPLVKLVDDDIAPTGPVITTKSRIFNGFGSTNSADVEKKQAASTSANAEPNASQRISKNKSSRLVFVKGKLQSQKGKYKPEPPPNRAKSPNGTGQPIEAIENPEAGSEDADTWGSGGGWAPSGLLAELTQDPASFAEINEDIEMAAPNDPPRHPSQELLAMAAATAEEGNELPDFEDDEEEQVHEDLTPNKKEQRQEPEEPSVVTEAAEKDFEQSSRSPAVDATVEEAIEPISLNQSSSSSKLTTSFSQNTLFADVDKQSTAERMPSTHRSSIFDSNGYTSSRSHRFGSVSNTSPSYTIRIKPNQTFPIVLDETVSSPNAMGISLETAFSNATGPVTGSFYEMNTAAKMLDALRSSGHAGRVALCEDATEEQRRAYEQFHDSLKGIRLFIATAGQNVLAFCHSTSYFTAKLNISKSIANIDPPVRILVCRVTIEDLNQYASLIDLAVE